MPFFGTWKWALSPKVPVFKCQKMALRTPKSRKGLQKSRKTPPKMVEQTFDSCVYHFWVDFKQISENRIFRTVLEPFSQQQGQKTKFARNTRRSAQIKSWRKQTSFKIKLKVGHVDTISILTEPYSSWQCTFKCWPEKCFTCRSTGKSFLLSPLCWKSGCNHLIWSH